MPLIPEPILDDIQSRTDVAELIGRYIPLQRAGRHFKALCPFHKERTPSFHINTDKQIFHCFGCGVGGNVFGFLMRHERLTFPEAVARLAKEAGVRMPEQTHDDRTDQLFAVLEKACRYYERMLAHPAQGDAARRYLQTRGLNERARQTFRLGYAPEGWDHLVKASRKGDVSSQLLEQAGLTVQGTRGVMDRFRQRLMFPIQDARGRIVSFGGRSLADQNPKYLNGPETPVYQKGRQLFGLAQAKEAIVEAKSAIVVEGYFDCVMLWQAGIEHVVSPLGTAFTPDQVKVLARYTDRVVLAFDTDAAGEAAAIRGLDVLLEAGLYVQVAQLPAGVDPDELVQQIGKAAFLEQIDKSLSVVDFLLARARRLYPVAKAEGKTRAAQSVLATIAKIPNAILRTEYVRSLAESLGLQERAVTMELGRVQPRSARPSAIAASGEARPVGPGAERLLTALVVDQPARWEAVASQRMDERMQDSRLKRVLSVVGEMRAADAADPTPVQIVTRLEEEGMGPLVSELVELAQSVASSKDKDRAFQDCVQRLRADARKRELARLRDTMRSAQDAGQTEQLAGLLEDYQRLAKGLPAGRQVGGERG